MNTFHAVVLGFIFASQGAFGQTPSPAEHSLKVMTFNIRYDNPADGPNRWEKRKSLVAGVIRESGCDLLGIQEGLLNQLNDMQKALPEMGWYGVGRDDGKNAGEFSALFFRKSRLELVDKGTSWLSETPDKPSKGWDAALPRIVSWGKFRDKMSGKVFFHFNSHFDHAGKLAREESAKCVKTIAKNLVGAEPFIITGDFNANPSSGAYQELSNGKILPLLDASRLSSTTQVLDQKTFNGFQTTKSGWDTIDYIFLPQGIQVLQYQILTQQPEGRFPSDHFPALAEILLK
ncbi:MAG: endonuclease/exonuclease/phosphatase family protein [Candidatus Ozemobacteraceae bacterium]